MKKRIIRNHEDLLAAIRRSESLAGSSPGSAQARELAMIRDAIKLYEDSIQVMRLAAKKAAAEPDEGVAGISGSE